MNAEKSRVIVANITWNDSGWRNIYINPKAGHKFARVYPGHESLNFKFDKEVFDDEKTVYGFVQWIGQPRFISKDLLVIFYSKNLETGKGQLVGVYGKAKILKEIKEAPYAGFESDKFLTNISAQKDLSLLFPIPLDSDKYSGGKRLVPQAGFSYKDEGFAERVIVDEIKELEKSGRRMEEYEKLKRIYTFITGEEYNEADHADDVKEQEEILEETRKEHDRGKELVYVKEHLANTKPGDPQKVWVNSKQYKRDNALIAKIKYLRGEKCQLCGLAIIKKDGTPYTEAAHIIPKSEKGNETPENILILCPNHHKEFDLGSKEIISLNQENFRFRLNAKAYEVDLTLK